MKININMRVSVKLTEAGQKQYATYISNFGPGLVDIDRTNFQLWELMEIFGSAAYVGMVPLFEDDEIMLLSDSGEPLGEDIIGRAKDFERRISEIERRQKDQFVERATDGYLPGGDLFPTRPYEDSCPLGIGLKGTPSAELCAAIGRAGPDNLRNRPGRWLLLQAISCHDGVSNLMFVPAGPNTDDRNPVDWRELLGSEWVKGDQLT